MNLTTLMEIFTNFHKNNHQEFTININDYYYFIHDVWKTLKQTQINDITDHPYSSLLWGFYGLGEMIHQSNFQQNNKIIFNQKLDEFLSNSYILAQIHYFWLVNEAEAKEHHFATTYQQELALFNELSEYGKKQYLQSC